MDKDARLLARSTACRVNGLRRLVFCPARRIRGINNPDGMSGVHPIGLAAPGHGGNTGTQSSRLPRDPARGQGGDPVAVWQRARLHWRRAGLDPQGATQLGRLGIIGELNQSEVAAGFKVAEVYGRYECSIGRRRRARSSSGAAGECNTRRERFARHGVLVE
jgi:hypothetical protein